jgi:predicted DNA-binding protein YlxM (UPF0122 family)
MEKEFYYVELFEIYKDLLTDRQKEAFSSHYLYDLSLSEVAEPENKSRQSVYDTVKKVKAKLQAYEDALGLRSKFAEIEQVVAKSKNQQLLEKIREITSK